MINICFHKRAKLEDNLEEKDLIFFINVVQAKFDQPEWVETCGKLINLSQNDQFIFNNILTYLYILYSEWIRNAKKSK